MNTYGDKRDYPKIVIFSAYYHAGKKYYAYRCCTTWSKTCRDAVQRWVTAHPLESSDVKARFDKARKS